MIKLPVKGKVKIWQGEKLVAEGSNRVVSDGLVLLAERILDGSTPLPSLFKLGDSAALTTNEMTELQGTEVAQLSATPTRRENVLVWSGDFTFNESTEKTCRELGLFQSNEDGGRMLARFLPLQQFILKNGTPIKVNWEITIGE